MPAVPASPTTSTSPRHSSPAQSNGTANQFEQEVEATRAWFELPRFSETLRLHTARQVVQQRGTIGQDYTIARTAAEAFYNRLRSLFQQQKSITTFGPYSPGQCVAIKRAGIEGIYVGGWATSAKGSLSEDPGPDLASYPLSQVPDEAGHLVRALLTADRNQRFERAQMSQAQQDATPEVDFRPFIIADADTGHGGEPHVRNLIRRFVENGVPGYHIEDQRPGTKKCGHQGGKVLVAEDEQIKRLNAARFQLDVMGVQGIIVARTDAEAATLLDGRGDERDQPFILGATNLDVPTYKLAYLTLIKLLNEQGLDDLTGHLLYAISEGEYASASAWLDQTGILATLQEEAQASLAPQGPPAEEVLDRLGNRLIEVWESECGLQTYGEAVAQAIEFRVGEGEQFEISVDEWNTFAAGSSHHVAMERARSLGLDVIWDCEHAKTPEGYYQVRGGIPWAIAKSLAAAPHADILWMETKTADIADAKVFADAIHAVYPDKMLAYNLSPSFNWDTTGLSEEEMRAFPEELAKLGFVFNFITYGGHQIDGAVSEEFAAALQQEGMLALAQLQRKLRLVESPYRTPQSLVGGPRADAALDASSGRTATTKAMGQGSTQHQHLVQTEVPPRLLEEWLRVWSEHNDVPRLSVKLRPHRAGSTILQLSILKDDGEQAADVIFTVIRDRRGRSILSVRDQNNDTSLRRKRLMTLLHVFLIHRYKIVSVHYMTPTDDNERQAKSMTAAGIFTSVNMEVGEIIVADVNGDRIAELVGQEKALVDLIERRD